MDFNSLGSGNPFYILKKGEKPILEVGVFKGKSNQRPQYQTQTPNAMNGMNYQQVIDITVTMNGADRIIPNVPVNVEIASFGNEIYSGSREAMLQAVDAMLQSSKKAIEQIPYHKNVISESEKMLETLNPRYAEEKKQARTIQALEEKQKATEQKLATLETQSSEMLNILRQLNGTPSPKA